MRSRILPRLFGLLLLTLVPAASHEVIAAPTTTTVPANPLIGRWQAISSNGKPMPVQAPFPIYWVIDSKNVTVTDADGKEVSRLPYSLRLDQSPTLLIVQIKGEPDRVAWFKVADAELRMVVKGMTGKPPKSWEDRTVLIFRRAAKMS